MVLSARGTEGFSSHRRQLPVSPKLYAAGVALPDAVKTADSATHQIRLQIRQRIQSPILHLSVQPSIQVPAELNPNSAGCSVSRLQRLGGLFSVAMLLRGK